MSLNEKNRRDRLRGLTLREQLEASIALEETAEQQASMGRQLQRGAAPAPWAPDEWTDLMSEQTRDAIRRGEPVRMVAALRVIEGGGDEPAGSRPRCSRDTWDDRLAYGFIGALIVLTILGVYNLLRLAGW